MREKSTRYIAQILRVALLRCETKWEYLQYFCYFTCHCFHGILLYGLDLKKLDTLPTGFVLVIIMMACAEGGLFFFFIKKQWIFVREQNGSEQENHQKSSEQRRHTNNKNSNVSHHVWKSGQWQSGSSLSRNTLNQFLSIIQWILKALLVDFFDGHLLHVVAVTLLISLSFVITLYPTATSVYSVTLS